MSIVNWVKSGGPARPFVLDGAEVSGIATSLRATEKDFRGRTLEANGARQFFGVVQSGDGFILGPDEARALLSRRDADYSEVVKPFLVGDDITSNPSLEPSRWIIDFEEKPLEQASEWEVALALVRSRVKPERDRHSKKREREEWWKFSRTVQDFFRAIDPLSRFIACPATAKRFYMVWCDPGWVPSNAIAAFAFEDDFAIGLLSSTIHTQWATVQSTRLETRPRYTVASFMTFPWPQSDGRDVAEIATELMSLRSEISLKQNIGLTRLYNEVDDGAWKKLRDLHNELDEAVALAYGWPASVAHDPDETNRRLLELNRAIVAGEVPYKPFEGLTRAKELKLKKSEAP